MIKSYNIPSKGTLCNDCEGATNYFNYCRVFDKILTAEPKKERCPECIQHDIRDENLLTYAKHIVKYALENNPELVDNPVSLGAWVSTILTFAQERGLVIFQEEYMQVSVYCNDILAVSAKRLSQEIREAKYAWLHSITESEHEA